MLAHDREAQEIGARGRDLAKEISFELEVASVRSRLAAWVAEGKHELLEVAGAELGAAWRFSPQH